MKTIPSAREREFAAVGLILAIIFITRLYHIGTPPIEIEESWRQGDTESIARNFAEYRFNILYPNFNYDGPLPNVPALEFQVTTFIIAVLYKTFGHSYFLARLIPVCFFMLSALFLYLISRKYMGIAGAVFSLISYGALPINIYYSRAIMPESAGLMFFTGGFYFFDKWFTTGKSRFLVLSSLFTSLAIMTKPITIFIGIPMLYVCFRETGWKWLTRMDVWAYAVSTLGLALLYYSLSIPLAEFKYSLGLTQSVLMKRIPMSIKDPASYLFILKRFPKLLSPPGIVLAAIGIFTIRKEQRVILVWFLAMALEVLLVVSAIRIYYYLIFFAVPCSLLIGKGLKSLYEWPYTRTFSTAVLFTLFLSCFITVKPMYRINTVMQAQIMVVEKLVKSDELIISGSFDPGLLSISGRRGWRFNIKAGKYKTPYEELNHYIRNGAKYFVPIHGIIYRDVKGELLEYLDRNYEKIEIVEGYPIYRLK